MHTHTQKDKIYWKGDTVKILVKSYEIGSRILQSYLAWSLSPSATELYKIQ